MWWKKKKKAYDAMKLCDASAGISTFNLFAKEAISSSTTRGRTNHRESVPQYSTVTFSSRQTYMFIHSGHFSQYTHCIHSYLRHIYLYLPFTHVYVLHSCCRFSTENMQGLQYQVLISVKQAHLCGVHQICTLYEEHVHTKEKQTNPFSCEYA